MNALDLSFPEFTFWHCEKWSHNRNKWVSTGNPDYLRRMQEYIFYIPAGTPPPVPYRSWTADDWRDEEVFGRKF